MIQKIRAWDKVGNEMINYIISINFVFGYITFDTENVINKKRYFDDITIMQSTGLHDNNGVEIFEYSELDGAYEVIFKDLRYSLRHIQNNDIIDLYDYWRCKNGEIEVTREYTKV